MMVDQQAILGSDQTRRHQRISNLAYPLNFVTIATNCCLQPKACRSHKLSLSFLNFKFNLYIKDLAYFTELE